ncbi:MULTISPECIES: membrane protein [Thermomonospora]|uniref:Integral membrane protein n=1 Tax=Thermomonospora curvata (strain ATCC 19995 / DSM 43183 / JCM 3096 / KCTC 9072 / NBRC 15933 / NCIMB 10081 / Henssen B9) TaxID=471852 RepID=D1A9G6_THECD|nr:MULTISPECIES: membrane protein [Thermomonospora]ACY96862.1 hypothetical protein Tcur_1279 [Thermomonospora curvata DSM 43183]PKK15153.1 MAG: hypothetical protein BUE48_006250 [Thermomonospora sp. CIF 1]
MDQWFTREIIDTGRLRLLCFFVAFICGFLFIRCSVRMIRRQVRWWPGNITPGGHHIHHVVFGLVLMCVGGVGGLTVIDTDSVWAAIAASLFGVGMALVLDEFALVLLLKDVYWSEQGRLSVEVVFIAIALCGLVLLGLHPLGVDDAVDGDGNPYALWQVVLLVLFNLTLAVITLLKGKIWTGLLGLFITALALVGAIRLARPGSPWARYRYPPGSRKDRRSRIRERRLHRPAQEVFDSIANIVAGRPSLPTGRHTSARHRSTHRHKKSPQA